MIELRDNVSWASSCALGVALFLVAACDGSASDDDLVNLEAFNDSSASRQIAISGLPEGTPLSRRILQTQGCQAERDAAIYYERCIAFLEEDANNDCGSLGAPPADAVIPKDWEHAQLTLMNLMSDLPKDCKRRQYPTVLYVPKNSDAASKDEPNDQPH